MSSNLTFSLIESIQDIRALEWSRVINTAHPFIQYDFLFSLEKSAATTLDSGWSPKHLIIKLNNELVGLMPLYLKSHSYGEYVFDFQWANAYHQSGLAYYPKLVSAIPFTPATGQRIYLDESINNQRTYQEITDFIREFCLQQDISSWHLLFSAVAESKSLSAANTIARLGMQYHWFNKSYLDFEHFLSACKLKHRKNIKRERRVVKQQGFNISIINGEDISDLLWQQFFIFYQKNYIKRSGNYGYLSELFFKMLGNSMPETIVMAVASLNNQVVATSLFFKDEKTLYGRYWGASQEFEFLHFELCYYQGIEYCIRNKLDKFDAGAQGEHKIKRGFKPIKTYSNHTIIHPQFESAIRHFVGQEQIYIEQSIQELQQKLPFKDSQA